MWRKKRDEWESIKNEEYILLIMMFQNIPYMEEILYQDHKSLFIYS